MRYIFSGNLPSNKEAEIVYTESGFMDYVKSRVKRLPNKSKMRIVSGTSNLPTTSKAVCDFIINELLFMVFWQRKAIEQFTLLLFCSIMQFSVTAFTKKM